MEKLEKLMTESIDKLKSIYMSKGNNDLRGRRFSSEKSANRFAKSVNGTTKDNRGNDNRKSNFKVIYTKGDANRSSFTNPHWN